jgi:hypothetical protein
MFLESNYLDPVGKARPICGINLRDRRYSGNHFMLIFKMLQLRMAEGTVAITLFSYRYFFSVAISIL